MLLVCFGVKQLNESKEHVVLSNRKWTMQDGGHIVEGAYKLIVTKLIDKIATEFQQLTHKL